MRLQKTHISLSLVDLKSNLEDKWKKRHTDKSYSRG